MQENSEPFTLMENRKVGWGELGGGGGVWNLG